MVIHRAIEIIEFEKYNLPTSKMVAKERKIEEEEHIVCYEEPRDTTPRMKTLSFSDAKYIPGAFLTYLENGRYPRFTDPCRHTHNKRVFLGTFVDTLLVFLPTLDMVDMQDLQTHTNTPKEWFLPGVFIDTLLVISPTSNMVDMQDLQTRTNTPKE